MDIFTAHCFELKSMNEHYKLTKNICFKFPKSFRNLYCLIRGRFKDDMM